MPLGGVRREKKDTGGWSTGLWERPRMKHSAPASSSSSGAFFIPYFIFFFTCGIPVFFLEVALGQYTSQGSVTAWRKICPLLQGECSPSPASPQATSLPLSYLRTARHHPLSSCAKGSGGHRKCNQAYKCRERRHSSRKSIQGHE